MILNAALPKIKNATNKALWDMWIRLSQPEAGN